MTSRTLFNPYLLALLMIPKARLQSSLHLTSPMHFAAQCLCSASSLVQWLPGEFKETSGLHWNLKVCDLGQMASTQKSHVECPTPACTEKGSTYFFLRLPSSTQSAFEIFSSVPNNQKAPTFQISPLLQSSHDCWDGRLTLEPMFCVFFFPFIICMG